MTLRLLLVDDEKNLAETLALNLEMDGWVVDVARDGPSALHRLSLATYDAVVLDVMLPGLDGVAVCRTMRGHGDLTPVVMLTARGDPEQRVEGLEAGADDYLAKPFALDELRARLAAVVRRRRWDLDSGRPEVLAFDGCTIDFATHAVVVRGEARRLTRLELDLVRFFANNAQRVLTRQELLEQVWGLRNYPNTRTVDVFVGRLRKLLERDPARPRLFVSVRGAGYRFVTTP